MHNEIYESNRAKTTYDMEQREYDFDSLHNYYIPNLQKTATKEIKITPTSDLLLFKKDLIGQCKFAGACTEAT
jgi:hypothetical protein